MDNNDPTGSAPRRRSNRQRKPKEPYDPSLPPAKAPKLWSSSSAGTSSEIPEQDNSDYRTGGVRAKDDVKSKEEKGQDSPSQCTSKSNKGKLEVISNDVSNGQEKSPISCVNEYDTERLNESSFFYMKEIDPENKTALFVRWTQFQIRDTRSPCWCFELELATQTLGRLTYSPLGRLCSSSTEGPAMIYECSSNCRCNPKKCPNRIVQNGITLPLQVFRKNPVEKDGKLWGLQALSKIPKDTFICEFVGELIPVFSMEAVYRMKLDVEQYYALICSGSQDKLYGISTRCSSNVSHYINHSIESNAGTVHVTDETSFFLHPPKIALFATQDIQPKEEITLNYLSPSILPS